MGDFPFEDSVTQDSKVSDSKSGRKSFAHAILGLTGGVLAAGIALTVPFVIPALRKVALPYIPTSEEQVRNVLHFLRKTQGKLIDLGSGDGRLVIEAAKRGLQAEGVELNPWLVAISSLKAYRMNLRQNTRFFIKDLWQVDLSRYDYIVTFGVESMMAPLEAKLERELASEGHVIVCRFPLPTWTPAGVVGTGADVVFLYRHPGANVPRLPHLPLALGASHLLPSPPSSH